jgi:hypothetical protein
MLSSQEINDALSSNFDDVEVGFDDVEVGFDDVEVGFDGSVIEEITESYDGSQDVELDFTGAKSLKDLTKTQKRATFSIKNDTTNQMVIAMTPANYKTQRAALVIDDTGTLKRKHFGGGLIAVPAGYAENDIIVDYSDISEIVSAGNSVDAVLDDGIIYALASDPTKKVTVTASKKEASVRHLLEYIAKNPSLITSMHISSSDTTMYETELVTKRCTPYGVYGEVRVALQDAFKPSNQITNKIIVDLIGKGITIDNETLSTLTIPAASTVTVTIVVGVVQSTAQGLINRLKKVEKPTIKKQIRKVVKRRK